MGEWAPHKALPPHDDQYRHHESAAIAGGGGKEGGSVAAADSASTAFFPPSATTTPPPSCRLLPIWWLLSFFFPLWRKPLRRWRSRTAGPEVASDMPSFQAAKDAGDISRLAVAEEEEAGRHRDGEEAELELGLSLGGKIATSGRTLRSGGARLLWGDCCRILTAEDFPPILASQGSPISSSSSTASSSPSVGRGHRGGSVAAAGNKRTADFVAPNVGSQRPSGQVVGWPPVRTYRMNSVINHSKDSSEGNNNEKDCSNGASRCKITGHAVNIPRSATKEMGSHQQQAKKGPIGGSLFVKVNMDGMPIGRKVDLNSHHTYEALAMALEEMFQSRNSVDRSIRTWKKANLLDGSSGFILTYEDKDGDWMLVGDVPWGMFLSTVQRLRIMRVPDVRGLGNYWN